MRPQWVGGWVGGWGWKPRDAAQLTRPSKHNHNPSALFTLWAEFNLELTHTSLADKRHLGCNTQVRKKLGSGKTVGSTRGALPGGVELTPTHGQVHIPMSSKAAEECPHAAPTASGAASHDCHMLTFCLVPTWEPTDEVEVWNRGGRGEGGDVWTYRATIVMDTQREGWNSTVKRICKLNTISIDINVTPQNVIINQTWHRSSRAHRISYKSTQQIGTRQVSLAGSLKAS